MPGKAKIKICGLFREEDIANVNEARPDYAGFVINFPGSHRSISADRLSRLSGSLDKGIEPVGVFVDEKIELVAELLNSGTISTAQLHGAEDNEYIRLLRVRAPGKNIIKAFKVESAADIAAAENSAADMILLDNGYGTGKCFDWSLIGSIVRPFILAGGLTPVNIPDAIKKFQPYAVDISSGVETGKVKDRMKIIEAVRAAHGEVQE